MSTAPVQLDSVHQRRAGVPPLGLASGLVLLQAIFFHRLILAGEVVFSRDTFRMHYPLRLWMTERLRAGELPLWFPYEALGVPFIESAVAAVFHPLTALHLVFEPGTVLTLSLLACVAAAAVGAFFLARRLGASDLGAASAALAYPLSGAFLSNLDNFTFLAGIAAFPLFLLGVHRARTAPGLSGIVLGALAVASTLLAGDLQAIYVYALAGPALALTLAGGRPLRRILPVAAMGVLGVALAAVQLLPTLSVIGLVERTGGFDWETAARWSLHPLRLPELFLGDLTAYTPGLEHLNVTQLYGSGDRSPWLASAFLGTLVGLGALWSFGGPERRLRIFLLGLTCVLGSLALGRFGGLYWISYEVLPFWSSFRYPEKLVPYAALGVVLLASLGITRAFSSPRRALRITVGVLALLLVLNPLAHVLEVPLATLAAYGAPAPGLDRGAAWAALLQTALLRASLIALLAVALLALRSAQRLRLSVLVAPLWLVAVFADLGGVGARTLALHSGSADVLHIPGRFATVLANDPGAGLGHGRVATLVSGYRSVRLPEVEAAGGVSYLGNVVWERQTLMPDVGSLDGMEALFGYLPTASKRFATLQQAYGPRFVLDAAPLFNVGHLVTDPEVYGTLGWPQDQVAMRLPEFHLLLARHPGPVLPRTFVAAPRAVVQGAVGPEELAEWDVRIGRVALVEGAGPSGGTTEGTARIVSYAPEEVRIEANVSGGPGVLVLNDAFHPGWRAEVDGRPHPVVPVNAAVRGVRLEEGAHDVRFFYPTPLPIIAGFTVSLLTALAMTGFFVLRRWRAG